MSTIISFASSVLRGRLSSSHHDTRLRISLLWAVPSLRVMPPVTAELAANFRMWTGCRGWGWADKMSATVGARLGLETKIVTQKIQISTDFCPSLWVWFGPCECSGWVPVEKDNKQYCWHSSVVDYEVGAALVLRPSADDEDVLKIAAVPLAELLEQTLELIGTNVNGNPYGNLFTHVWFFRGG